MFGPVTHQTRVTACVWKFSTMCSSSRRAVCSAVRPRESLRTASVTGQTSREDHGRQPKVYGYDVALECDGATTTKTWLYLLILPLVASSRLYTSVNTGDFVVR